MQEANKMPVIAPTAHVATNATIIGDVTIGEECCILFNAVIRGDCGTFVKLGDRTNVQEGACLHVSHDAPTVVGHDVTIGHAAVVHGCTIGDHSLVGMGATVLDGAQVGSHCLIGAGALVTGTARIPDGMLVVGSPARAKRPLTDEEMASLDANADEYVQVGYQLAQEGWLLTGEVPESPLGVTSCKNPQ